MTSVALTGASGFLGWHIACRLRALHGVETVRIGRAEFADPERLADCLATVDQIIHVAGVNRAESESEVEAGNVSLAAALDAAVRRAGRPMTIVFANSVQADLDNAYGRGKAAASRILARTVADVGGVFTDVLLPNLFGEHGRPEYNSFVATFAHEVIHGRLPIVSGDREIALLHAQDAAEALIGALHSRAGGRVSPPGTPKGISEVLGLLKDFHALYASGEVPDLSTKFAVDLFNTYRSLAFPGAFPISPTVHADARGSLFETVRAHGGTGQAFVSTTVPGATRGNHYHLHKVERFFVVKGEAEIRLRRLFHDEIVTFRLSGERPSFVDMPTMWVHEITNVGHDELVTMFWSDQLLDPNNPDQYPEMVRTEAAP